MLYTVNIDANRYIVSVGHTKEDNIEINLDLLDLRYLNAYRLIDSEIVLDEARKAELVAAETQKAIDEEIADLKQKLTESDYIVANTFEQVMSLDNALTFVADFIKIMADFRKKYADLIINRKNWRARIEELEG